MYNLHCVCVCFILKIIAESCDKNLFEKKHVRFSDPICEAELISKFRLHDVLMIFQAQRKPTGSARCGTVGKLLKVRKIR